MVCHKTVHVTEQYSYKTVHGIVQEIIDSVKLFYFNSLVDGKIRKETKTYAISKPQPNTPPPPKKKTNKI
jgi:hypothetical protein